jgi:hypothetical protein
MTLSPHPSAATVSRQPGSRTSGSLRVVPLGSEVDPVGLQNCMTRFKPTWQAREPICVDLQECRKFDVIALLYLIAAAAARSRQGTETRFRLPNDKIARQYLRMWRFPSAVGRATQTPFRLLVDGSDGSYFGEQEPTPFSTDASDVSTEIVQYLTKQSFFGFSSYDLSLEEDPSYLLEAEPHRWRNPLILRLLQRHLNNLANDVPRVIIQELLNAMIRHSPTVSVILASQLDVSPERADHAPPCLTIGVWCDSDWATDVIDSCRLVANGGVVTSQHNPKLLPRLIQLLSNRGDCLSTGNQLATGDARTGIQDRGIAALYRTVIEGFGGSIEITARTQTLTIARNAESKEVSAELGTASAPPLPTFLGSLVAIRVPVSR